MIHRRLYPKDGFMAHAIGYVGEVSEDMLNSAASSSCMSAATSWASPAWSCNTTTF